MRLLSQQEQKLCIRILEGHGSYNCIQNIIDHDLKGVLINIEKESIEVEIPVNNINPSTEQTQLFIAKFKEISILIITLTNLIDILEKEGYILAYQSGREQKHSRFGQGIANSQYYVTNSLTDKRIVDLCNKLVFKDILVTPEFARFCNNGFIARDEQRFKKQITVAYIALGVALFAAFVNLSFNLYNSFWNKEKKPQIEQTRRSL